MFKDRLKKAMKDLKLNQVQVSGMTGRSRASICQYLAGAQVPPDAVQRSMAAALGLDVEYFTAPDAPQHTDPVPKRHGGIRPSEPKATSRKCLTVWPLQPLRF